RSGEFDGLFFDADQLEGFARIIARRVELAFFADDQRTGVGDITFHALEQFASGTFLRVAPMQRERGAPFVLAELVNHVRLARKTIAVVPGGDRLDARWIAEVERHEGHVERVASHIPERTGAEVPPAAPAKRVIVVAVGTLG